MKSLYEVFQEVIRDCNVRDNKSDDAVIGCLRGALCFKANDDAYLTMMDYVRDVAAVLSEEQAA